MKTVKGAALCMFFILVLSSCQANLSDSSSDSQLAALAGANNSMSPFILFERLEKSDGLGINADQVDKILQSYGVYDQIVDKITKNLYDECDYADVSMTGYNIGNKNTSLLRIKKGHLYIYVMFSNGGDEWTVDGFTYHNERFEPEHRIEQSSDGAQYWLVVKYESNHGTGLQLFDEAWYNPDGSVAAQYPLKGSTVFFPQNIEPSAYADFSADVQYNDQSTISLSYTISFSYSYKDSYPAHNTIRKFQSVYRPAIRETWEYDLEAQELRFISCSPALPDSFNTMKHEASAAFGIFEGYINFYRMQLGDKKVTTLEEWERFMGVE